MTRVAWQTSSQAFGEMPAPNYDPRHQAQLRAAQPRAPHMNVMLFLSNIAAAMREDDQRWRSKAACTSSAELFFPTPDEDPLDPSSNQIRERGRNERLKQASAICKTCPARDGCMAYAMRLHSTDKVGYYAGHPWRQRKRALARLRATAITRPPSATVRVYADAQPVSQPPCVVVEPLVLFQIDPVGSRRQVARMKRGPALVDRPQQLQLAV